MTVKRRNRPNRYSDDLLLGAAAEVFHRRGFHDASMVDIAARAGVTKPTLYARFGNKGDLYDTTLERLATSLVEEMEAAYVSLDSVTPEEATVGPAAAFFGWVRDHPIGFALLFADEHGAPTGVDHRERALETLTEVIGGAGSEYLRQRGLQVGAEGELVAACVVGAYQRAATWALRHDAFESLPVSEVAARFVLQGLAGMSPEPLEQLARRSVRREPV